MEIVTVRSPLEVSLLSVSTSIVWGTFQLSGVKVTELGMGYTPLVDEVSGMVTLAVGGDESTVVKLAGSPSEGESSTAVNSIPKGTSSVVILIVCEDV